MPMPVDHPVSLPAIREFPDTTAVAIVFGLADEIALRRSAEALTLQASFVLAAGLSGALLADSQGARFYRVGDPLPGGSVLRRVELQHVVLWNKGREESLPLAPSTTAFLRRIQAPVIPSPAPSARFLRPLSGQSE
ncbi:hypothetical protein GIW70_16865 [Pseudomonas syringae]|nr:hypothetical protein [Pseudomonas syringae]MCF5069863.1 hypothetical protein [Pseudomonas syringae]